MLTDEIDALTARIEKLRKDQDIANEAEHFETRATQIEKLAEDLHSPTDTMELLRKNSIEISVPAPPAGLISFAENMKQLLENDRGSVLSDTGGFGQKFKTPLGRLSERVKTTVTSAWENHVDRNIPKVNQKTLSVLANMKGFADSVSTFQRCFTQYMEHRTRTPTGADDIRRFDEALEALQNAHGSLRSDEVPEEVLDFIHRATSLDGFPLDGLSDEIRDWLRENELFGQYVVKTA